MEAKKALLPPAMVPVNPALLLPIRVPRDGAVRRQEMKRGSACCSLVGCGYRVSRSVYLYHRSPSALADSRSYGDLIEDGGISRVVRWSAMCNGKRCAHRLRRGFGSGRSGLVDLPNPRFMCLPTLDLGLDR